MGAMLQCSFGAAPSSMVVLPANRTTAGGVPAATIMDNVPLLNIMPFGVCSSLANPTVAAATAAALGVLTPMPCIPATATPWAPGAPTATDWRHAGARQQLQAHVQLGRGDPGGQSRSDLGDGAVTAADRGWIVVAIGLVATAVVAAALGAVVTLWAVDRPLPLAPSVKLPPAAPAPAAEPIAAKPPAAEPSAAPLPAPAPAQPVAAAAATVDPPPPASAPSPAPAAAAAPPVDDDKVAADAALCRPARRLCRTRSGSAPRQAADRSGLSGPGRGSQIAGRP